jgi:hypothetical protein
MQFLARAAAWALVLRSVCIILMILAGVILGLTGGAHHR